MPQLNIDAISPLPCWALVWTDSEVNKARGVSELTSSLFDVARRRELNDGLLNLQVHATVQGTKETPDEENTDSHKYKYKEEYKSSVYMLYTDETTLGN